MDPTDAVAAPRKRRREMTVHAEFFADFMIPEAPPDETFRAD